jgi:hypothetical protein
VIRAVLLLVATTLLATPAWAGTVRLGIFVGNDVGMGPDEPLQHAEREARDVARLFQDLGDLARERTVVLQGGGAAELNRVLVQVEAQVREAAVGGDEVMLLFYYSGHASAEGLHMRGTLFGFDALRRWLETSGARVRVAFVDACESGTLARQRGGTPVDAIEITVDDALTTSGLAVVSSTGPLSTPSRRPSSARPPKVAACRSQSSGTTWRAQAIWCSPGCPSAPLP